MRKKYLSRKQSLDMTPKRTVIEMVLLDCYVYFWTKIFVHKILVAVVW